jgi:hypothetical protein
MCQFFISMFRQSNVTLNWDRSRDLEMLKMRQFQMKYKGYTLRHPISNAAVTFTIFLTV